MEPMVFVSECMCKHHIATSTGTTTTKKRAKETLASGPN
jgi:hypothetical protein